MPAAESPAGMPKTRASPPSGFKNPISSLIVVVFPAPFRPRKPKMLPAGTSRLRPVSAGCPLKDFWSPRAWITQSLIFPSRCLPRAMLRQFVFKQPSYLVFRQPKIGEPVKRGLDNGLGPFRNPGSATYRFAHKSPGPMLQLDDSFMLKFAVGTHDRVRVHHQVFGHTANSRELVARLQRAGFDGVPDLLHQLEVHWQASRRIEPEDHCLCVLVN